MKTKMVAKISSLGELAQLVWSGSDVHCRWAMVAAQNLGWSVPKTEAPDLAMRAVAWLRMNANETSVIREVNAVRDLVGPVVAKAVGR